MTLQNLSKILDRYHEQLGCANVEQLKLLKGLPFYPDWHQPSEASSHQNHAKETFSFNHVIGLPRKNGRDFPLFDYEQLIFDILQTHKHVWIKKATGLGITEFMLRFMAWLCLKDDSLKGSQMCIVTGPRIDLAVGLIARLKMLFNEKALVTFDTKENVIVLNGIHLEAYPSHHLDAMRGILHSPRRSRLLSSRAAAGC